MFKRLTFTLFHAAVVLTAAAAAVWFTVNGHTLRIEGLLLALGAVLAAVLFAFRLAGGPETGGLSIWTGPFSSVRPPAPERGRVANTLRSTA